MIPFSHLRCILITGLLPWLCAALACEVKQDDPSGPEVWEAYNIIDGHAHIGSFQGFDLRTETLLDNLRRYHIDLALISNINGAHLPGTTRDLDEVAANEKTRETVEQYPNLLRALAWARPTDANGSPENLEPYLRDHGFVGVKLHPEMNQFPADSAVVDGYLALCAQYGVPAVFHCGAPGSNSAPEKIYAAAKRHPDVPVVLYHMGFFGSHDEAIATVKAAMDAGDARLYLGTAQADPQAVLKAVQELGAGRVLFGTDATYYGEEHYRQYEEMIALLKKNLTPEDFSRVVRENALQLFDLVDED